MVNVSKKKNNGQIWSSTNSSQDRWTYTLYKSQSSLHEFIIPQVQMHMVYLYQLIFCKRIIHMYKKIANSKHMYKKKMKTNLILNIIFCYKEW
jgi:hypothetical protein